MRRIVITIGLIGVLSGALLISGCTKKKENKILLRWSGYAAPVYDKFRMEESKKFEKLYPNVKVRYEPIPGEFDSKLLTQIAGRTAPDIFFAMKLGDYAERGVLVDLTEYVRRDKDYFKDINPTLMEAQCWNKRVYALPGNCTIQNMLFYNKKLFDEEGLSCPDDTWTWKDLVEASKKLTKRAPSGRVTQFGCVTGASGESMARWMLYILQNGGKLWNKDKTNCIINSPEAREAIQYWKDFYAKYHLTPNPMQAREEGESNLFVMGKAAMFCGATWNIATFKIRDISKRLDWDAIVMPAPEDKKKIVYLGFISLGVWTGSKHPELAYELAKFMSAQERIKFLVKMGDSLPLRKKGEAMEYFLNNPDMPEKIKEVILKALTGPAEVAYPLLVNSKIPYHEQGFIIRQELEKFIIADISAEITLQTLQKRLNDIVR
ncbi:sugar ABC transporter substrate-binding protein [candidate division WOR-3 bacterium]|nr:sugar ABC transporter substrate-binding protein [candidate division WOR-3 bacterium]